jgi:hypothetical protein
MMVRMTRRDLAGAVVKAGGIIDAAAGLVRREAA